MRLPARTSCSACSSGPTATRSCSRASHSRDVRSWASDFRAAASTRLVIRRSASSRRAIRFGSAEEPVDCASALRPACRPCPPQTREQIVGRQVDELDLVGFVEHMVGQGLLLPHSGDLRDEVVQAFEVLDIDRRPDVDARLEQLLDVLPALRMTRSGLAADEIRVRELVDEQNRRSARERGVEIELAAYDPAILRSRASGSPPDLPSAARSRRGRAARRSRPRPRRRRPAPCAPPRASRRSCRLRRSRRRRFEACRDARAPLRLGRARVARPGRGGLATIQRCIVALAGST